MTLTLNTAVTYLKGLGPQRTALLAERGITTVGDLLSYLPFRYEDRIHFTPIAEILPGQVATVRAQVESGSLVRFARRHDAMFHLLVKDGSGKLAVRFFHGNYLDGKLKPGQPLVLHGKATLDPNRPLRTEMINPEFELLRPAGGPADSTEVGGIGPVYEAIGNISSRMLRRIIYAALQEFRGDVPDPLPPELLRRYAFPSRRDALIAIHFPPPDANVEALNELRGAGADDLRGVFSVSARSGYSAATGTATDRNPHARARGTGSRSAEARTGGNRVRSGKTHADEPAARRRRGQRQNNRGSRSGRDCHRKWLSGCADGANGNSRRAALPVGAAHFRARRVFR